LAVAFIDIDRFKGVNDSLGHSAGDYLLVDLGNRLADDIRPGDTVARLGGDEFTMLWTGLDDVDDARWRCEEVLARLREPVRLRGQELFVTGSMGVAVFPDDGTTAQVLVRRADLAMYEAKRSGRNAYRFWVRAHDASLPDLRREGELHAAIDGRELIVHYQPVIDLATGQIRSVEALARWNHPVVGLLPPEEFIGLAEELGLVTLIDGWVLQHATEQMATWHRAGLDHVSLAVNVSAHRFEDLSFIELVASQLERTGLAPGALQLEMTESVAIRDATDTILKLSELGVSLVMDDFGTGYSMLSRLRSFPLDALKIDRSFMSDDPDDQALVEAIVSMGRSLGLEVVAEGVESLEQHLRLRSLGCHLAQGYFYSKPLAAEEVEPLLRTGLDMPAVRPDVP
jgi:diguanylate cyclase (GGDEF)-like protein